MLSANQARVIFSSFRSWRWQIVSLAIWFPSVTVYFSGAKTDIRREMATGMLDRRPFPPAHLRQLNYPSPPKILSLNFLWDSVSNNCTLVRWGQVCFAQFYKKIRLCLGPHSEKPLGFTRRQCCMGPPLGDSRRKPKLPGYKRVFGQWSQKGPF